jgi:hypothetical protein
MHELNNSWTMWIHYPYDNNWGINSYKKITNFSTLEDSIMLIENINKELIEKSMMFFMKENIKPLWEDSNNINGGFISYKLNIDNVYIYFKKLVYNIICNNIIDNEEVCKNINGISISPKKHFCIIKIWLGDFDKFNDTILNDMKINTDNQVLSDDPFSIHNIYNIEQPICLLKKHNYI